MVSDWDNLKYALSMTTIGTIKPSGDKEALYHKLIHTTTTARVILCKCWWTLWNWAVVSPTPRFRCQNNHREGPNIFLWVRVDYDQINSLEVWHRTVYTSIIPLVERKKKLVQKKTNSYKKKKKRVLNYNFFFLQVTSSPRPTTSKLQKKTKKNPTGPQCWVLGQETIFTGWWPINRHVIAQSHYSNQGLINGIFVSGRVSNLHSDPPTPAPQTVWSDPTLNVVHLRPPLNKKLFPVHRPGDSFKCRVGIFFSHFPIFLFFPSIFLTISIQRGGGGGRFCGLPTGHYYGHPLDRKHTFF